METAPRPQILVIETETLLPRVIRRALTETHDVHIAHSAQEARLVYEQKRPDIVLSGVQLVDQNGLELAAELYEKDPTVQIMIMSGGLLGKENQMMDLLRKGVVQAFLPKPFTREELYNCIDGKLTYLPK